MLKVCNACRQRIFCEQLKWSVHQTKRLLNGKIQEECQDKRDPNSFSWRTHSCGELSAAQVGQSVKLCGWIQHKRFDFMLTLRDAFGVTQVVLPKKDEESLPKMETLEKVHLESVIMVQGMVQFRPEGLSNPKMPTGDIEVVASDIKVLNPSKDKLPIHINSFQQAKESLRMQYRYLDLRSSRMQRNLRLRSTIIMRMREFLCNQHGFVDVETPSLFRKTPGGAKEFLVPTRHRGKFYTLPQSPQQFKQLLMVGGIDRYFQIARCYRDEGSRADRQPEFTQVDIEMSFVNKDGIYAMIEQLLEYSWPRDKPKLSTPFPRMNYSQAMAEYGSDKPDTRFNWKIKDVTTVLKGCGPSIFNSEEDEFTISAVNCKGALEHLSNCDFTRLQNESKKYFPYGVLCMQCKDEDTWKSAIAKHLPETSRLEMAKVMDASRGDVLFLAAGNRSTVTKVLGHVRLVCADILESRGVPVRDPNHYSFLWVEDFPLFLPSEGRDGELESSHHPFTAPVPEHSDLIYTSPLEVKGQHYDLVLNGAEIGGGSIRIHNAELQEYVLEKVLKVWLMLTRAAYICLLFGNRRILLACHICWTPCSLDVRPTEVLLWVSIASYPFCAGSLPFVTSSPFPKPWKVMI
ncbi:aspartate--tRNA ligase, mitochondrial-like isoform X2 [Acanthaster planci]|uniref:Aspartate--tRNA ligase, mitochondrial-like isoform X2 n=1 Tax=Acanthaster planci TaxID=133434 RepID=A0A8B7XZD3_ACAPL|nr:aspartate--tRNA ligase, mitochondrial-like isoform X2 [Acanthaster planci]